MKTAIFLLFSFAAALCAETTFETWVSADGREATLKLLEVTEVDGEKVGRFSTRSGQVVQLKASELSDEDAKRLEVTETAASSSEDVFQPHLDGNLVQLVGDRLEPVGDVTPPKKYYVFYYTASWCGPCQAFTPRLVEWYKEHKNDNFEIVLISSDRNEAAMEKYAAAKKMPWPQLKMSKVKRFRGEFSHPVAGIPSVIVCQTDGTMLGNFRSKFRDLTELVN